MKNPSLLLTACRVRHRHAQLGPTPPVNFTLAMIASESELQGADPQRRAGHCHKEHAIVCGSELHTNPTLPAGTVAYRPRHPVPPALEQTTAGAPLQLCTSEPSGAGCRPAACPCRGDRAQVGVVGADERLQLVVRKAVGPRYSVEKGWDDVDAIEHGPRAHAARAPQRQQQVFEGLPCSRKAPMQVAVLRRVLCCHEAKVACLRDPGLA
eukprot:351285-Chlamydomonas_euryale.AAC.1